MYLFGGVGARMAEGAGTRLTKLIAECDAKESWSVPMYGTPDHFDCSDPTLFDDISSLLDDACAELQAGEMIHPDQFGLDRAMTCLEIMDPKMDSAMEMAERPTLKLNEAYRAGLLPRDDTLQPAQIMAVMDRMMQAEVAFYQGHNLLQTLFTCYYLHDLRPLQQMPLRVYGHATLKAASVMREMIMQTDIFDEEDFNGVLFGFRLLSDVPSVFDMIDLACADLSSRLEKGTLEMEDPLARAMIARLRFKKLFCEIQIQFEKSEDLSAVRQQIHEALHLLQEIEDSHEELLDASTVDSVDNIFCMTVARRVLLTAPPNTIPVLSFQESIGFLRQFLKNCAEYCQWPSRSLHVTDLMDALEQFNRKNPDMLSRARLYRLFLNGTQVLRQRSMKEVVYEDMMRLGISPELLQDPSGSELIDHTAHCLILLSHSFFNNRSRLRSKLYICFQELGSLQSSAESYLLESEQGAKEEAAMDCTLAINYITEIVLQAMVNFVKLGFELDLYSHEEYALAFWYLDFLYGRWSILKSNQQKLQHEKVVQGIHEANAAAERAALTASAPSKRGKGKAKKVKKVKPKKLKIPDPPPPTVEHLFIEAQQSFCRGLSRLIIAIRAMLAPDGNWKPPQYEFGSANLRFFQRFGAFHQVVTPPALWYNHYEKSMDLGQNTPKQVLNFASEMFGFTKKCLDQILKMSNLPDEELVELKNLTRAALTNKIAILRFPASAQGRQLQFSFDIHPLFPVVSLSDPPSAK